MMSERVAQLVRQNGRRETDLENTIKGFHTVGEPILSLAIRGLDSLDVHKLRDIRKFRTLLDWVEGK